MYILQLVLNLLGCLTHLDTDLTHCVTLSDERRLWSPPLPSPPALLLAHTLTQFNIDNLTEHNKGFRRCQKLHSLSLLIIVFLSPHTQNSCTQAIKKYIQLQQIGPLRVRSPLRFITPLKVRSSLTVTSPLRVRSPIHPVRVLFITTTAGKKDKKEVWGSYIY